MSEDTKKLEVILNKRRDSIELTKDEQAFVDNSLQKMLDGKACARGIFVTKTGDEIRKSQSSPELKKPAKTGSATEAPEPQQRAKEGGFDSQANVAGRTTLNVKPSRMPAPTTSEDLSDQKEVSRFKEDTSGKVKEEYKGDNVNADNKDFKQEFNVTDRVARQIDHGKPISSTEIQAKDLVTKINKNGTRKSVV